ncbi:hypothetical protein IT412_01730, partial [Candidatus Peregrinibacteria bacterium]|nr:hypothetical protein [Candidatus Peregrinibacteria bacterium]
LTAMLKQKLGNVIARNLEHFLNVNYTELAEQLIDMGDSQAVAWNLKKFRDIDHAQIAKRIMAKGEAGYIARYLENFAGLHHAELADWLIDHGKAENLAANLRKFVGVDHNQIAAKMLSNGDAKVLYNYLHNFHDLDKSIAIGIIDMVIYPQDLLKTSGGRTINVFKNLDESVALHMAEKGMGAEVCGNLAIFGEVDLRKLAEAMVKKSVNAFADCIEHFGEMEMDGLADLAIKNNQAWDFVTRLDEFRINDFARLALEFEKANLPQAMVKCLYLAKDEEQKKVIRSALEKHDKQSLAEEVFREGDFIVLRDAMDYFRELDFWDLAKITIKSGSSWVGSLPDIIRYFNIDNYFDLAEKFSNFKISEGVAECWKLCTDQQQKATIETLYNLMGLADPNLPPLVKTDQ